MNTDKIVEKLFEQDKRFDQLEEKITKNNNEVLNRLDYLVGAMDRMDQERIFTNHAIRRLEQEAEQHTKEIKQIKEVLKIA